MRVIAGLAKGRKLKAPAGAALRPSSERVRGALFSMLEAAAAEMGRVLDLYAGTGAIGIEALSRGATWVDFVENDREMARAIADNLKLTGFANHGRVQVLDVKKALPKLSGPYDVIFMDPPYADEHVGPTLRLISDNGLCSPETLVIVEHARRRALGKRYGKLALEKNKTYGDTMLSIFRLEASL